MPTIGHAHKPSVKGSVLLSLHKGSLWLVVKNQTRGHCDSALSYHQSKKENKRGEKDICVVRCRNAIANSYWHTVWVGARETAPTHVGFQNHRCGCRWGRWFRFLSREDKWEQESLSRDIKNIYSTIIFKCPVWATYWFNYWGSESEQNKFSDIQEIKKCLGNEVWYTLKRIKYKLRSSYLTHKLTLEMRA